MKIARKLTAASALTLLSGCAEEAEAQDHARVWPLDYNVSGATTSRFRQTGTTCRLTRCLFTRKRQEDEL